MLFQTIIVLAVIALLSLPISPRVDDDFVVLSRWVGTKWFRKLPLVWMGVFKNAFSCR
jgi:hypothetical protein